MVGNNLIQRYVQSRLHLLQEMVGAGVRQHHGKDAENYSWEQVLLLRWGKMRSPAVATTTENVPLLKWVKF